MAGAWRCRLASGRWEAKSQLAHRRSKIEYQTFRPWSTTYTELGQGSVRACAVAPVDLCAGDGEQAATAERRGGVGADTVAFSLSFREVEFPCLSPCDAGEWGTVLRRRRCRGGR